jgi:hypothetical protein
LSKEGKFQMSDLLKVNACVYSRKGCEQEENRDDFYMNGKFLSERNIDNIEASVDHRGSEFSSPLPITWNIPMKNRK